MNPSGFTYCTTIHDALESDIKYLLQLHADQIQCQLLNDYGHNSLNGLESLTATPAVFLSHLFLLILLHHV